MRPLLRGAFAALLVAAVVLVATFAAEMSAMQIWLWARQGATADDFASLPDVAFPLAILAFIATFGWNVIRWRRSAARGGPPAS